MRPIPIREISAAKTKSVEPNQKAVDALPLNSGEWRVKGIPGLYLRSRATKSFRIQRRVHGRLIKETLGPIPVRQAKELAMAMWAQMHPEPAGADKYTFAIALEQYLEDHDLADTTRDGMNYILAKYLGAWRDRSLKDIGNARPEWRAFVRGIKNRHGVSTMNGVIRCMSCVYRWAREEDLTLPEPPTTATKVKRIPPRQWAYSADELRAWWASVLTVTPIKRAFWLTLLLTGCRRGSAESLKWSDIDLERKVIHFRVAKGGLAYSIPANDALAQLLTSYRDGGTCPPGRWVFPSVVKDGMHIVNAKDPRAGIGGAHHLRHTFRTNLTALNASPERSKMLLGHKLSGVSEGYITAPEVIESLRPLSNQVAARYEDILGIKFT